VIIAEGYVFSLSFLFFWCGMICIATGVLRLEFGVFVCSGFEFYNNLNVFFNLCMVTFSLRTEFLKIELRRT